MQQNHQSRQQISIGNFMHKCKLIESERIDTALQKGYLETYDIENYGITQPFLVPDGMVLDSQIGARQERSGMPVKYVYKTGKDFKWDCYGEDVGFQKGIANMFVSKFNVYSKEGRGLYIFSKTKGSGKTMLACCLANEILKKHDMSVKFITVMDYLELIKDRSDSAQDQVKALYNAGILILDDIGAEGRKDWIDSAIFRLVNNRSSNMGTTLYTSNCEIEELTCDERIKDRILETSIPVIMPEKSIRSQKARKDIKEFLQRLESEE